MNTKVALKQLAELKKLSGSMRLAAEEWKSDWQTLIAIMLSARTRDEVTIVVAKKLFAKYKTLSSLSRTSISEIQKIIRPVNFYRNKSKSVLGCAKKLIIDFNSKVPFTIDELVTIPGVGRKTANVFLSEFGGDAIGVDTHVSHISQYLGWTKHSNAHKIEIDLKKLFPKSRWNEVNVACVHFGKTFISTRKENELLDEIKKKTKN